MENLPALDAIDHRLIELLHEDARRTVADIASQVGLSPTAVKRRIDRLEVAGVIVGYSARIDHTKLGWSLEAFTEVRFRGTTRPDEMDDAVSGLPEVVGVFITAGTHDALVWLRATDVRHLRAVIDKLRATAGILDTRTYLVLDSHIKRSWRPSASADGR